MCIFVCPRIWERGEQRGRVNIAPRPQHQTHTSCFPIRRNTFCDILFMALETRQIWGKMISFYFAFFWERTIHEVQGKIEQLQKIESVWIGITFSGKTISFDRKVEAFFYEFNYSRRLSISHIRPARSISKLEFPLPLWSFVAKYGFSAWGKLQCAQARNTKDLISNNFSVKYILGRIDKMAAAMFALDFRKKSHLPLFPVKHNEEKQGQEQ